MTQVFNMCHINYDKSKFLCLQVYKILFYTSKIVYTNFITYTKIDFFLLKLLLHEFLIL